MELTVILPSYNEEKTIIKALNLLQTRITQLNYTEQQYEIIVVDDGSTDKTPLLVKNYIKNNPNIKYIRTPHKGKGNAIKTGLLNAKGEIIGIMDSDLEVRLAHPEKLPEYLNMVKNSVDIIIGSKRHPQTIGYISPTRRLLSIAFNNLARLLTGIKVKDTQTGLKIIKKTVVEKLKPYLNSENFTLDLELLLIAQKNNYKITEIPVKININNHFKITEIIKMIKELIKITYKLKK